MSVEPGSLEQDRARGERAKALLEDPLLAEAFAAVGTAITERWRSSEGLAPEDRERLWLSLRLLDKVKGWLQSVLSTGVLAAEQVKLDELQARQAASRARKERS